MHFSYGGVDLQNRGKGLGFLDTGHHDQNMNLKNQELGTFCSQIQQYNHVMLESGLMIVQG